MTKKIEKNGKRECVHELMQHYNDQYMLYSTNQEVFRNCSELTQKILPTVFSRTFFGTMLMIINRGDGRKNLFTMRPMIMMWL